MKSYISKIFIAATVYGMLWGCGTQPAPKENSVAIQAPQKLTLYSIDFREMDMGESDRPKNDGKERIGPYVVMGKIEIEDASQRQEIMAAIREAIQRPDDQFKCFWPRHLIRVVETEGTTEIAICFECRGYLASGAHPSKGIDAISDRPKELLNKILADAKIEVLPETP